MDLATREVQRQRSERQRQRDDKEKKKVKEERERGEAASAVVESELRSKIEMLSSELESWRRRAETAERSVLGMSRTIADKSAAQEASARAADIARAAAREAERRLEDAEAAAAAAGAAAHRRRGRSDVNVDGSPLPFDVLSLNDTPGAPCVMCGYQTGKPYKGTPPEDLKRQLKESNAALALMKKKLEKSEAEARESREAAATATALAKHHMDAALLAERGSAASGGRGGGGGDDSPSSSAAAVREKNIKRRNHYQGEGEGGGVDRGAIRHMSPVQDDDDDDDGMNDKDDEDEEVDTPPFSGFRRDVVGEEETSGTTRGTRREQVAAAAAAAAAYDNVYDELAKKKKSTAIRVNASGTTDTKRRPTSPPPPPPVMPLRLEVTRNGGRAVLDASGSGSGSGGGDGMTHDVVSASDGFVIEWGSSTTSDVKRVVSKSGSAGARKNGSNGSGSEGGGGIRVIVLDRREPRRVLRHIVVDCPTPDFQQRPGNNTDSGNVYRKEIVPSAKSSVGMSSKGVTGRPRPASAHAGGRGGAVKSAQTSPQRKMSTTTTARDRPKSAFGSRVPTLRSAPSTPSKQIASSSLSAGGAAAGTSATASVPTANKTSSNNSMADFFAAEIESELIAALESVTTDEIMIICASHWPPLPAAAATLQNRFGVDPSHAALRSFGGGGGGGGGMNMTGVPQPLCLVAIRGGTVACGSRVERVSDLCSWNGHLWLDHDSGRFGAVDATQYARFNIHDMIRGPFSSSSSSSSLSSSPGESRAALVPIHGLYASHRSKLLAAFRSYCAPPPDAIVSASGVVAFPPGGPLAGTSAAGHVEYINGMMMMTTTTTNNTTGTTGSSSTLYQDVGASEYEPTVMSFPQWVAFALAAFCEVPRVSEAALIDSFSSAAASERGYTRRAVTGSASDSVDYDDGGARSADPDGCITFAIGFLEAILRLALHLKPQLITLITRDDDDNYDDDETNVEDLEKEDFRHGGGTRTKSSGGGAVYVAPGQEKVTIDQTMASRALGKALHRHVLRNARRFKSLDSAGVFAPGGGKRMAAKTPVAKDAHQTLTRAFKAAAAATTTTTTTKSVKNVHLVGYRGWMALCCRADLVVATGSEGYSREISPPPSGPHVDPLTGRLSIASATAVFLETTNADDAGAAGLSAQMIGIGTGGTKQKPVTTTTTGHHAPPGLMTFEMFVEALARCGQALYGASLSSGGGGGARGSNANQWVHQVVKAHLAPNLVDGIEGGSSSRGGSSRMRF